MKLEISNTLKIKRQADISFHVALWPSLLLLYPLLTTFNYVNNSALFLLLLFSNLAIILLVYFICKQALSGKTSSIFLFAIYGYCLFPLALIIMGYANKSDLFLHQPALAFFEPLADKSGDYLNDYLIFIGLFSVLMFFFYQGIIELSRNPQVLNEFYSGNHKKISYISKARMSPRNLVIFLFYIIIAYSILVFYIFLQWV